MALKPRTLARPNQIIDELVRIAEDLKSGDPWWLRGIKTVRSSWSMAQLNDETPGLFMRWENCEVVDGAAGYTYQKARIRMRYVVADGDDPHRALLDGVSDVKLLFRQHERLGALEWVKSMFLVGEEAPTVDVAQRAGAAYCDIIYEVTYEWPEDDT